MYLSNGFKLPLISQRLSFNLEHFTASQQEEFPGVILEISHIPDPGNSQCRGSIERKAAPVPSQLKGIERIIEHTDGNERLVYNKSNGTKDVGILEVDLSVSNGIGRVQQDLTFSVELDAVSGFVDAVGRFDEGEVGNTLGLHTDVLLVHVLDVVDVITRAHGHCL